MPESGYYRTSPKEAKARTARIKERRAAAATPEGKAATAKRLLSKRAALEARMTPAERRKAERRRVDAFMERRNKEMRPQPATPEKQAKLTKPSLRHPFPSLTGPNGALGKKKGNK